MTNKYPIMGPNKKCLSWSNKNVLEIFEFWRLSDHRRQIRCNFSLRLSNYQLVSIYDKRFFVKILSSFLSRQEQRRTLRIRPYKSWRNTYNEGRVEEEQLTTVLVYIDSQEDIIVGLLSSQLSARVTNNSNWTEYSLLCPL